MWLIEILRWLLTPQGVSFLFVLVNVAAARGWDARAVALVSAGLCLVLVFV